MKRGQYEVGDRITVYSKIRDVDELCDRGEYHSVPVYLVKRLTITDIRQELVKALNYTSDGTGNVLYAVDAQGREYRKEPHWEGPRATVWLRLNQEYSGTRRGFDQHPRNVFSRDALGNPLHFEHPNRRRKT